MSGPAKSLFYFAFYMIAAGVTLLFFPRLPLAIFGLPEEGLLWVRLMGMLVLVFSYYYMNLARKDVTDFFRWTVHTRALVPVFFAGFIAFADMPPLLMLFALGDLAGAIWTAWALKRDGVRIFGPARN